MSFRKYAISTNSLHEFLAALEEGELVEDAQHLVDSNDREELVLWVVRVLQEAGAKELSRRERMP